MTLQTVSLSSLVPPTANPRSGFDAERLEGLAQSIAQDGVLQNLVVSKGRGAQYRIISGERRYRALRLLEEQGKIDGDFAVPVELRAGLGKDDKLKRLLAEAMLDNTALKDLLGRKW